MREGPPGASKRGRLRDAPLVVLATVVVLVDDAFRAAVLPLVRALARLAPLRALEAWVAGLRPYPALALFLVPFALTEVVKLGAAYAFATGRFAAGVGIYAAAQLVGVILAERLFSAARPQLLSVAWFARGYGWVVGLRDAVRARLARSPAWIAAMQGLVRAREASRAARAWLATRLGGRLVAIVRARRARA